MNCNNFHQNFMLKKFFFFFFECSIMALIVRLLIWNSKNSNAFVKNQTPISLSNMFFKAKETSSLKQLFLSANILTN